MIALDRVNVRDIDPALIPELVDLAVIDVTKDGFKVLEMVAGMTPAKLQELTGATLHFV